MSNNRFLKLRKIAQDASVLDFVIGAVAEVLGLGVETVNSSTILNTSDETYSSIKNKIIDQYQNETDELHLRSDKDLTVGDIVKDVIDYLNLTIPLEQGKEPEGDFEEATPGKEDRRDRDAKEYKYFRLLFTRALSSFIVDSEKGSEKKVRANFKLHEEELEGLFIAVSRENKRKWFKQFYKEVAPDIFNEKTSHEHKVGFAKAFILFISKCYNLIEKNYKKSNSPNTEEAPEMEQSEVPAEVANPGKEEEEDDGSRFIKLLFSKAIDSFTDNNIGVNTDLAADNFTKYEAELTKQFVEVEKEARRKLFTELYNEKEPSILDEGLTSRYRQIFKYRAGMFVQNCYLLIKKNYEEEQSSSTEEPSESQTITNDVEYMEEEGVPSLKEDSQESDTEGKSAEDPGVALGKEIANVITMQDFSSDINMTEAQNQYVTELFSSCMEAFLKDNPDMEIQKAIDNYEPYLSKQVELIKKNVGHYGKTINYKSISWDETRKLISKLYDVSSIYLYREKKGHYSHYESESVRNPVAFEENFFDFFNKSESKIHHASPGESRQEKKEGPAQNTESDSTWNQHGNTKGDNEKVEDLKEISRKIKSHLAGESNEFEVDDSAFQWIKHLIASSLSSFLINNPYMDSDIARDNFNTYADGLSSRVDSSGASSLSSGSRGKIIKHLYRESQPFIFGFNGKPGVTWMKEDKLINELRDNLVAFLRECMSLVGLTPKGEEAADKSSYGELEHENVEPNEDTNGNSGVFWRDYNPNKEQEVPSSVQREGNDTEPKDKSKTPYDHSAEVWESLDDSEEEEGEEESSSISDELKGKALKIINSDLPDRVAEYIFYSYKDDSRKEEDVRAFSKFIVDFVKLAMKMSLNSEKENSELVGEINDLENRHINGSLTESNFNNVFGLLFSSEDYNEAFKAKVKDEAEGLSDLILKASGGTGISNSTEDSEEDSELEKIDWDDEPKRKSWFRKLKDKIPGL